MFSMYGGPEPFQRDCYYLTSFLIIILSFHWQQVLIAMTMGNF